MRTTWNQIERSGHPTGLWAVMMAVLMACMMGPPASAADGKRVAFVVGIGTYDNLPSHQQLKNPLNDADGVSKKLADIGFQVVKAPNLTRSDFNTRWQDVLNGLTNEDTFVLFFSGHGVQVDGHNYLLPRDIPHIEYGRQAQLTREAISLNQLLADLTTGDRPHPKRSVVILDACRDNPLIPQEFKGAATRGGLAKLSDSDGTFVIYSAGSNRTALDRLGPDDRAKYSVFTRVLLPLLGRQDLSIQELSTRLKDEVWTLAKKAGREQRPAYYDGILGRFCLPGCVTNADMGSMGLQESLVTTVRPLLQNELTGKDGAPMVLIPAGEFWMGSTEQQVESLIAGKCVSDPSEISRIICREGLKLFKDEVPLHRVYLDAYYMDKLEVTFSRYSKFMRSTNRKAFNGWENFQLFRHDNLPVVGVEWDDADTYCRWAGKRLPTEAEWEKAARGTDGRIYPWGNEEPNAELAKNTSIGLPGMDMKERFASVDSNHAGKSPYGLFHMAGNASEWVSDWYDPSYYTKSPNHDPRGPSSGDSRVLRGGFWDLLKGSTDLRSARRASQRNPARSNLGPLFENRGMRCAQDAPK